MSELTVIVPPELSRTKAPLTSIPPPSVTMLWLTVIVVPVKETSPISVPITAPPVLSKTMFPVPAFKVTFVFASSPVPLI